jgi:4-hydroxy-tetrahydrodipicolinate reductase
MNIAIVGYGRMGHEIEEIAVRRGHSINLVIDKDNVGDLNAHDLEGIDAAIEFTLPDTALGNILTCLELKIPVVSGTTGWLADYEKAAEACRRINTSFIHSTNFSLGVNILFRLNSELARIMAGYPAYAPSIEEVHHIKKLDAPSGTAISLARGIMDQNPDFNGWSSGKEREGKTIPITSIREGSIPGIHTVSWESDDDNISLKHDTKSRKGLALGAVIAAEYISVRKGIFTMSDVLGF